jgi:hypothetical protein
MKEVSVNEFGSGLTAEQRDAVACAQAAGMGVAMFTAERIGGPRHIVTYGTKGADIVGLPPKTYGGAELVEFVSPPHVPQAMRSPLMDAVGGPPQIARPPVSQTQTSYPSVEFEMRTSSHPRGDQNGYITPGRPEPEYIEAEPVEAGTPEAWWRARIG